MLCLFLRIVLTGHWLGIVVFIIFICWFMINHKVYIVVVHDKSNRNLFHINKCWYDSTLAQQVADDFNDKYLRCHIFRIAYVQELFIDDSYELARSEDI